MGCVRVLGEDDIDSSLLVMSDMNGSEYSGYQGFEWAVKLNRISLEVIGLWPKPAQNHREKLICNIRSLIALLALIIFLIIPCIHSLIKIYSDIMLTVDNLIYTLPFITCALRIIIFWWKKETIVPIMTMIAEDWLKCKSTQERNVMIRWAQSYRIIMKCAYFTIAMGFTVCVILPRYGIITRYLINSTDPANSLPIQGYYIYDISHRIQYEMTYLSQFISTLFAVMAYIGVDNFLGLLIFHICGQLTILKNRLSHLSKSKHYHHSLRTNIMDHIRLLRAIASMDDAYNIILFTLFLYFVIIFAVYGFLMISLFDEDDDSITVRVIRLISIIIVAFGHMLLYCAVGELLVNHCDNIHHVACNQDWYSLYSKDARDLIFLIIRSSKPPYLTAGKILPITIPTFCNLLKTSIGYISVLLTTRN